MGEMPMSRNILITLAIATAVLATNDAWKEGGTFQAASLSTNWDDTVGDRAKRELSAAAKLDDERFPQNSTPDNPYGTFLSHAPRAKLTRTPGLVVHQRIRCSHRSLLDATISQHRYTAWLRTGDVPDATLPSTATEHCVLLSRFLL